MWRSGGRKQPRPKRVGIVGAGITGLAAAHRVRELTRSWPEPVEVRVFDSAPEPGGTIATERTADGFVIEHGPDSFLTEKPWAVDLCRRLGMDDELQGTREEFRRTYIVRSGRLYPLPEGFLLMAPTRLWPLLFSPIFSSRGKARLLLDLVLPARRGNQDESLASFVRRRLGREALERVAQPLIAGIYTADPERLSLSATMPRFLEIERQHRSVILGMRRQSRAAPSAGASGARWGLFAVPRGGMGRIVDALVARLPQGSLLLRTPVRGIRRTREGTWLINGNLEFDVLILACPAWASAALLRESDPRLAAQLEAFPYTSSAVVTLAYRREEIPHPLDSFGFVVPFVERRGILACTFASLKYEHRAPPAFVLLRAFVGGELQPGVLDREDAELVDLVRRELAELLGVVSPPFLSRVRRHMRAMAIPHVGHLEWVRDLRARATAMEGLFLAGSALDGIGIPNCIRSGEAAAESALAFLREHVQRPVVRTLGGGYGV